MKLSSVRSSLGPSLCLSVGPSVSSSPAATLCCGRFAAERRAGNRYRSNLVHDRRSSAHHDVSCVADV